MIGRVRSTGFLKVPSHSRLFARPSWERRRTQAFTHLHSHSLFRDRFGRPGKGNDKGKVEALVKTARRRFMVPIPKVHDLSVLNERLLARCLERLDALEAGERATALLADLDALRDLPAVPFEACEHVPGQVSSTALVRYRLRPCAPRPHDRHGLDGGCRSLRACDGVTSMWYTAHGDPIMTVFSWQPDRNDVQNMQALDRMTDLGFELALTVRAARAVVGFNRESGSVARSEDWDRRVALLRAALAAAKSAVD